MARPLTPQQERFVLEYAKDLNATQAAKRAGYKGKYLRNTAVQLLCRTRAIIEERKAVVLAARKDRGIASMEQTLRLCTMLAFGDDRKLFDTHGNCRELPELTRTQALRVAGFQVDELYKGHGEHREKVGYTRKYKVVDRAPFANMLLRYHGAFDDEKRLRPGANGAYPITVNLNFVKVPARPSASPANGPANGPTVVNPLPKVAFVSPKR